MRGVELHRADDTTIRPGTSPRARGRGRDVPGEVGVDRNIPACAGSSTSLASPSPPAAEHPRVRGVEVRRRGLALVKAGTSPRARGRGRGDGDRHCLLRNIPACAGSRTGEPRPHRSRGEHPRVRGVEYLYAWGYELGSGTSPRARGRAAQGARKTGARRNIPACAGSSTAWSSWSAARGEHPRVRGVELPGFAHVGLDVGTSPRARGRGFATSRFTNQNSVSHSLHCRSFAPEVACVHGLTHQR